MQLETLLKAAVVNGERPLPPDDCEPPPTEFRTVMHSCWEPSPALRPSFAVVLEALPPEAQ